MAMADMNPAPKKRRGRKTASAAPADDNISVFVLDGPQLDPKLLPSGAMEIPHADGSVVIDFASGKPRSNDKVEFDDNLALHLDDGVLNSICEELMDGISADDDSRSEWLNTRAKGMDLLGLKVETPSAGATSAPVEGMSVVRHPLLLEAVLRFQADARGELLPSNGPVKVRQDGEETAQTDLLARTLEKDLNHYLTTTAREYYPDTDRMLFSVGFGGCAFKKVYHCPLKRRPVSETVDAKDLIVSNAATDLRNASRVTHRIPMRKSVMKRMQILGVYRKVALEQQQSTNNPVDIKIASIQGVKPDIQRNEDQEYSIDECYCELDIDGFKHKDKKGAETGLPLPYRVTIDRQSRQILEIRRNWEEDDEDCTARTVFVKYSFVPGYGFYDYGLLNILGNTTNALTAAWREMLDAGMFANFPGFIYSKSSSFRQTTNQFRVPPGGGIGIDTGNQPIQNSIMALPYKEPGPGLTALVDNISQTGLRVGGASQASVAEGKQEAPVGTTLALIEQASKVMSAVHKRLHAAQSEEFGLLRDRFREDPSALWRTNKRAEKRWGVDKFMMALDQYDLVPCADPNTPSQMHRLMKAQALKQLAMSNPPMYDMRKVDQRVGEMADLGDMQQMFAPPAPPAGPDPMAIEALKLKQSDQEIKKAEIASNERTKDKDRASKETTTALQIAERLATHPEAAGVVNQELSVLTPFLHQQQGMKP